MFLRLALVLSMAAPVAAQDWQVGTMDNGAWFEANARSRDRRMMLHCGGVSPRGLPLPGSDEPILSDPGTLLLAVNLLGLGGEPTQGADTRADLAVVVGSTGFRLPAAGWDWLNQMGWLQVVGVDDPLIAALAGARTIAVYSAAGQVGVVSAAGAADAVRQVVRFCRERWGAVPQASPPVQSMRDAVDGYVRQVCQGDGRREPGWLTETDFDGDGQTDYILDWMQNFCVNGTMPVCSPSACSIDLFLSSDFPRTGAPQSVMGAGYTLGTLQGGRPALRVVNPAACQYAADRETCAFIWVWNGAEMQALP